MPKKAVHREVASNLWISKVTQEGRMRMTIEFPIHLIQLILYERNFAHSVKGHINY